MSVTPPLVLSGLTYNRRDADGDRVFDEGFIKIVPPNRGTLRAKGFRTRDVSGTLLDGTPEEALVFGMQILFRDGIIRNVKVSLPAGRDEGGKLTQEESDCSCEGLAKKELAFASFGFFVGEMADLSPFRSEDGISYYFQLPKEAKGSELSEDFNSRRSRGLLVWVSSREIRPSRVQDASGNWVDEGPEEVVSGPSVTFFNYETCDFQVKVETDDWDVRK